MKSLLWVCIFGFASWAPAQVGGLKFFRHQGQTVELGDSKYEVLARIGNPDGKLQRDHQYFEKTGRHSADLITVHEEKWLFNFGPRRFFHILTFEDQRLTCIETGDYGFQHPDAGNCHPVSKRVKLGEITPVILMKCGDPSFTDVSYVDKYLRYDEYTQERVSIRVEEWTYNFGSGQPLGILRFENGELVEFIQGPRGF